MSETLNAECSPIPRVSRFRGVESEFSTPLPLPLFEGKDTLGGWEGTRFMTPDTPVLSGRFLTNPFTDASSLGFGRSETESTIRCEVDSLLPMGDVIGVPLRGITLTPVICRVGGRVFSMTDSCGLADNPRFRPDTDNPDDVFSFKEVGAELGIDLGRGLIENEVVRVGGGGDVTCIALFGVL